MSLIIYLNGTYIQEEDAKISVFDSGFLYGDGVYESFRIYNGKLTFIEQHYLRLKQSAEAVHYKIDFTKEDLTSIVQELLQKNKLNDAYVRLNLTRGLSKVGFGQTGNSVPTLCIIANAHKVMPDYLYKDGIRIELSKQKRFVNGEKAQIKAIGNLISIQAKLEAKFLNVLDVLLLNNKGHIAECSASNIFWIKDNVIYTPSLDTGVLEGVTRKNVIDIVTNDLKLDCSQGEYKMDHLLNADEAFITSTSLEVMPVVSIGELKIGDGKVGKHTFTIQKRFKERLG